MRKEYKDLQNHTKYEFQETKKELKNTKNEHQSAK